MTRINEKQKEQRELQKNSRFLQAEKDPNTGKCLTIACEYNTGSEDHILKDIAHISEDANSTQCGDRYYVVDTDRETKCQCLPSNLRKVYFMLFLTMLIMLIQTTLVNLICVNDMFGHRTI